MSSTAIGSTPAKGSSNKIKQGSTANALAISVRLLSPPESTLPILLRTFCNPNSSINCSSFSFCSVFVSLVISRIAKIFSSTVGLYSVERWHPVRPEVTARRSLALPSLGCGVAALRSMRSFVVKLPFLGLSELAAAPLGRAGQFGGSGGHHGSGRAAREVEVGIIRATITGQPRSSGWPG